jgi:hypothetical protein
MLKETVGVIPYPRSAVRKLLVQSRAARLSLGMAVRSVSQLPSVPPVKVAELTIAAKAESPELAERLRLLPALPGARAVMVTVVPLAAAHTAVEPSLISSTKQVAILAAVSPIRFR